MQEEEAKKKLALRKNETRTNSTGYVGRSTDFNTYRCGVGGIADEDMPAFMVGTSSMCHDHFTFNVKDMGSMTLLRTQHYFDKIDGLEGWDGFWGRWYFPDEKMTI